MLCEEGQAKFKMLSLKKNRQNLPDFRCSLGSKSAGHGVVGKSGNFCFSLLDDDDGEDRELSINNATTNGFSFPFSCLSWSVAGVTFAEEKTNTSLGQNTLFHGETLLVVSSGDTENIPIPFFTQSCGIYFSAHALFIERTNLNLEQHLCYYISNDVRGLNISHIIIKSQTKANREQSFFTETPSTICARRPQSELSGSS